MPTKPFEAWYGKNREDYNAKRRQRYAQDKGYRSRVKGYTKRYRADNPQRVRQSDGSVGVLVNGRATRGFRTGAVASRLSVTAEAIRYLEKQGYIPSPSLVTSSTIRTYTKKQIRLIKKAFDLRKLLSREKISDGDFQIHIKKIFSEWT